MVNDERILPEFNSSARCLGRTDTKIELGLLSPDSILAGVDFKTVKIAPKPLLAVVCYNQALIDALKGPIIKAVEKDALGIFFFGKTGDLSLKQGKNKVFFN